MKVNIVVQTYIMYYVIVLTYSVDRSNYAMETNHEHFYNSMKLRSYNETFQNEKSTLTQNSKTKSHDQLIEKSEDMNTPDNESSCRIQPYHESVEFYSKEILDHGYNFMYLNLTFYSNESHQRIQIAETKKVINKYDWIWTFKGEYGAHQYLFLPGDFGYLSFGLLWSHTRTDKMNINFRTYGNCSDLRIGTNKTDLLIGNALGNLTSEIATLFDRYNYSYWCYNYRLWIESHSLYWLCRNSICTFQTFEYRCCKYVVYLNNTRDIECSKDHYHFGALWWMLPIIIGNILFAFYPIVLVKVGMTFSEWTAAVKKRPFLPTSLKTFTRMTSTDRLEKKYKFVSLKGHFPITFMSTIFSPVCHWDCSGPITSRIIRLWVLLLPVSICTIRVLLDNKYAHDLVKGAVMKNALVGFSSLIAGIEEASRVFLPIFNGPVTALAIFLSFSCAFVLLPKHFDHFLEKGLRDCHSNARYMFLYQIPLKLIERYSGISIRKSAGYKRFYSIFIAQTFMLLHWRFWRHVVKLFCARWTNVICPGFVPNTRNFLLLFILYVFMFPIYLLFCFIELVITVLYFMFPVINSIFLVLKATLVEYFALFKHCGKFLKFVRIVLLFPLFGLFLVSWYMYCIIFFDAFWFLTKITMFTYAGVIAYPKISYGYMILCFMSIYYLIESARAFGDSYRELLKISIEVVEKVNGEVCEDEELGPVRYNTFVEKHSLHRDLFLLIVDRHRPRRNQILITLLKFGSVITLLTISVELLITFDKIQDLSLVSHVFTVLFVCALPKLVRNLCMENYKSESKRRLRSKIKKTFLWFLRHCQTDWSFEDYEFSNNGYSAINSTYSNDESSD
ncbi:hypothetical protein ACF0H5_001915 [Mactra antiquata]